MTTTHAQTHVDLEVLGMTCTSCSARVERKLNKMEGVEAQVNFATETASVLYDAAELTTDDLVATIEAAGYKGFVKADPQADNSNSEATTGEQAQGTSIKRCSAAGTGTIEATRAGVSGAGHPRDADVHDSCCAVHLLAMGQPHPRGTGVRMGWVAVPPSGVEEPAARRVYYGHADFPWYNGRFLMVADRPVLGRSGRAGNANVV